MPFARREIINLFIVDTFRAVSLTTAIQMLKTVKMDNHLIAQIIAYTFGELVILFIAYVIVWQMQCGCIGGCSCKQPKKYHLKSFVSAIAINILLAILYFTVKNI